MLATQSLSGRKRRGEKSVFERVLGAHGRSHRSVQIRVPRRDDSPAVQGPQQERDSRVRERLRSWRMLGLQSILQTRFTRSRRISKHGSRHSCVTISSNRLKTKLLHSIKEMILNDFVVVFV